MHLELVPDRKLPPCVVSDFTKPVTVQGISRLFIVE